MMFGGNEKGLRPVKVQDWASAEQSKSKNPRLLHQDRWLQTHTTFLCGCLTSNKGQQATVLNVSVALFNRWAYEHN